MHYLSLEASPSGQWQWIANPRRESVPWVRIPPPPPSFAKASKGFAMYYTYILKSSKSGQVYTGWTTDLRARLESHNSGENQATKSGVPWEIVYYSAFETEKLAKDFEHYLKTGSGIAFARKRLIKDLEKGGLKWMYPTKPW